MRDVFQGHDGSLRVAVGPGEGEFVCADCDAIDIAARRPGRCRQCGGDRIETLTTIRPSAWSAGAPHG